MMIATASVSPSRQRGVVLLFCLVILVILLAGGVAVMRSMNSSLFSAGNLAFRRDLVNQGELAVSKAMQAFKTGGLATSTLTSSSVPAENYSAIQLKVNKLGIPDVLLKKTGLTGKDITNADFTPTGGAITGAGGVTVHYVIDRLCNATGSFASLSNSACVSAPSTTQVTGGTAGMARPEIPPPAIYRLSIRVDGPRDTQVFLQSSFSRPE
ncbi:pilus assembly PilX family protein [Variovorax sp. RA8]|uniref:pilus assembly PilX family protein n=1 Tax=Variovorax sp. (strain JCM 16519 / RA8) TaxID=662548 RepID=UPI000AFAEB08|nr:hypothetical protein [Variovorax sp. RA8]VTU38062.1 Tfp pilus assembly protein PilX [Variovorax sp. RA8]